MDDLLIQQLTNVSSRTNREVTSINCGGCGMFAAIVGSRLIELGIVPEVIVGGPDDFGERASIDKVRTYVDTNAVPEWEMHGVYFCHVGLRLQLNGQKYLYDSCGLVEDPGRWWGSYQVYHGALTVQEIVELAECSDGWNSDFNRRRGRNQIQAIVDDVFGVSTDSTPISDFIPHRMVEPASPFEYMAALLTRLG